jgi:hypothetical protein
MSFLINGSPPITDAMPEYSDDGPILFVRQEEQERTLGGNQLCTQAGLPMLRLTRRLISSTGLQWWLDLVGASNWAEIEFTAISPVTNSWVSASGVIWRPFYEPTGQSACLFQNFSVQIVATCLV